MRKTHFPLCAVFLSIGSLAATAGTTLTYNSISGSPGNARGTLTLPFTIPQGEAGIILASRANFGPEDNVRSSYVDDLSWSFANGEGGSAGFAVVPGGENAPPIDMPGTASHSFAFNLGEYSWERSDLWNHNIEIEFDASGSISRWDIGLYGQETSLNIFDSSFSSIYDPDAPVPLNDKVREYLSIAETARYPLAEHNPWSVSNATPDPQQHIIAVSHGFVPSGSAADRENYMSELIPTMRSRLESAGVDLANVHFVDRVWDEAFVDSPVDHILNAALSPRIEVNPVEAALAVIGEGVDDFNTTYRGSYAATADAGAALANEILDLRESITSGESAPTIHLVGHSLGSVVNARAVNDLYRNGVSVELVTILDSPKQASVSIVDTLGIEGRPRKQRLRRELASFDDALLFWSLMPDGSATHVENFYGTQLFDYIDEEETFGGNLSAALSEISVDLIAADAAGVYRTFRDRFDLDAALVFGQPIAGTTPCVDGGCSGLELTGRNHTTVWKQFYQDAIRGDEVTPGYDWKTPALYGDEGAYPSSQEWRPGSTLARYVDALNQLTLPRLVIDRLSISFLVTANSDTIDDWQRDIGTILFQENQAVATSNSPSAFSAQASVDELLGVEFTYAVEGATTGILSLHFEDALLWQIDLASGSSLADTVYVSLLDTLGEGRLVWTYDSDEIGSTATFSDLALLEIVAVPEPAALSCVFLLLLGASCAPGRHAQSLRNSRRS